MYLKHYSFVVATTFILTLVFILRSPIILETNSERKSVYEEIKNEDLQRKREILAKKIILDKLRKRATYSVTYNDGKGCKMK